MDEKPTVEPAECPLCAGYGTVHPNLREKVIAVECDRLRAELAESRALAELCRSAWTRNLTTVAWHVGPRGRPYEDAQAAAEAEVAHAIETWREERALLEVTTDGR